MYSVFKPILLLKAVNSKHTIDYYVYFSTSYCLYNCVQFLIVYYSLVWNWRANLDECRYFANESILWALLNFVVINALKTKRWNYIAVFAALFYSFMLKLHHFKVSV